jgi:formylglycine-generating enzyme required for sulfatase activity
MMGSPGTESGRGTDEGPVHTVRLSPFAMCQTEVTQSQYQQVMSSNPSSDVCTCDQSCGDDYPVSCVSWFDAVTYLNALSEAEGLVSCYDGVEPSITWVSGCTGYRLPTEAEWEFAARADTDSAYPFGNVGELGDYAWFSENSDDHPHSVAGRQPTVWAEGAELYDMQGNLWEWVWDRYRSDYYADAPTDNPINSDSHDNCIAPGCRVIRGGAFLNVAADQRAAKRNSTWPAQAEENIGFRCARSLPVSP